MRYRVHRIRESRDDLRAAQKYAGELGDRRTVAELILEEVTALDWAWMFEDASRRVADAAALIADCDDRDDPRLLGRYHSAVARRHYRQEEMADAVRLYTQAIALAGESGDVETHIVSLLLLGLSLFGVGRFDEAIASCDEVIELCQRENDRLHLCAAYGNRVIIDSVEQSAQQTIRDLRRAVKLAREVGQPILERNATHNLGEFLHWSGRHREALRLARRAYVLQRFLPERVPPDALLVARISAALDGWEETRDMVAEVRELALSRELTRFERAALLALELLLAEETKPDEWERLVDEARFALPGEEFLEILYFRASDAANRSRWDEVARTLTEARDRLAEQPVWQQPFDRLTERQPID